MTEVSFTVAHSLTSSLKVNRDVLEYNENRLRILQPWMHNFSAAIVTRDFCWSFQAFCIKTSDAKYWLIVFNIEKSRQTLWWKNRNGMDDDDDPVRANERGLCWRTLIRLKWWFRKCQFILSPWIDFLRIICAFKMHFWKLETAIIVDHFYNK